MWTATKIFVALVVITGLAFAIRACNNSQNELNAQHSAERQARTEHNQKLINQYFTGEHSLRRLAAKQQFSGQFAGEYFMFGGGHINGQGQTYSTVQFAWTYEPGMWTITELPLDRVKVNIKQDVDHPTITFFMHGADDSANNGDWDVNGLAAQYTAYVVITCRDSDWPTSAVALPSQ